MGGGLDGQQQFNDTLHERPIPHAAFRRPLLDDAMQSQYPNHPFLTGELHQLTCATEEALRSQLSLPWGHEELGTLLGERIQGHAPDDIVHATRDREPA